MVRSVDGGVSFSALTSLPGGGVDQATVVIGPGRTADVESVWVVLGGGNYETVMGAEVSALGGAVSFSPIKFVSTATPGNFGDMVIGSNGELLVTFQSDIPSRGVYSFWDQDGLGLSYGFTQQQPILPPLNVFAIVSDLFITPQSHRPVGEEIGLARDRSNGLIGGRVYLMYTDTTPSHYDYDATQQSWIGDHTDDTDIFVRYSDDVGLHWSPPVRVNDDMTAGSQFLPRLAIDQTTGNIAVGFYDSSDDPLNHKVSYYLSISRDGGRTFSLNRRVSVGLSDADQTPLLPACCYSHSLFDFGDYSGLDFHNGIAYPIWGDNSNSTLDNPQSGALDVYAAKMRITY